MLSDDFFCFHFVYNLCFPAENIQERQSAKYVIYSDSHEEPNDDEKKSKNWGGEEQRAEACVTVDPGPVMFDVWIVLPESAQLQTVFQLYFTHGLPSSLIQQNKLEAPTYRPTRSERSSQVYFRI